MTTVLRTPVVAQFSCLGDKCEDTCCQNWSMQLDTPTLERYKQEAPELLDAVEPGDATAWVMRRDKATGFCVRLENGLCGIHKQYGDKFLGDACHFYPRVTRALGDTVTMTATLSCPEIARLAFAHEGAFVFGSGEVGRLPHTLKNYLPDGMTSGDALSVHQAFLDAVDDAGAGAEHIFCRIASVSRSLEMIDKKNWAQAAPMYLKLADGRLPQPEPDAADPFNLLHALCGLIVASKKPMSPRLRQTVEDMERALCVSLDWDNVLIHTSDKSMPAYEKLNMQWKEKHGAQYENILRRILQMQLSLALYPFSGLGGNLSERVTIIGVRLATIRLALMCSCGIGGKSQPLDMVVRVVQSLSRFLDHLGDPAFSLQIYAETGWNREPRMCALLET